MLEYLLRAGVVAPAALILAIVEAPLRRCRFHRASFD
jgi:hypothetical protein